MLLMQTGAQDFHIFPRAWCEANKIKRDRYDTIVNKTPLFYKSNRIIGGSAPSVYLARLLKEKAVESEDRQDEILRTHGIAPAYLRADDFLPFYEARREALLRLIESAMGKAAYRGEAALAETTEASDQDQDEEQEDEIVEAVGELAA